MPTARDGRRGLSEGSVTDLFGELERRQARRGNLQVMGFEGLSGNESIPGHLQPPSRVSELGSFTAPKCEEWVPAAHAHRLCTTRVIDPARWSAARSVQR